MTIRTSMQPLCVLVGVLIVSSAGPAFAQKKEPDDATLSPCMSSTDCYYREMQRDDRVRRENWNAMLKTQADLDAQLRQSKADAAAQTESGRLSRVQEVMRRRREAAAAGN